MPGICFPRAVNPSAARSSSATWSGVSVTVHVSGRRARSRPRQAEGPLWRGGKEMELSGIGFIVAEGNLVPD
jgi:hypothetical protein